MAGLKVVALISGGKDSFFSILHCLANGHDIVALANLYPSPQSDGSYVEDSDSFMYQTVGHTVIPLYEQALEIPLFRQAISGVAVNQRKHYGPCASGDLEEPDETESLTTLLTTVLKTHPKANAVSTGAILSDYQRTRVESIALRLGLTPLSYLWQYPNLQQDTQTSLLEDMEAAGQDARVIKVASGGLDDSFLWQNVADPRTRQRLIKASQRFGTAGDGSALGEGGEYETLAISGPSPLWKKQITVEAADLETVPGEAGSASLRVRQARVKPLDRTDFGKVRIPDLLDGRFSMLLKEVLAHQHETEDSTHVTVPSDLISEDGTILIPTLIGRGNDASEQTLDIMRQLEASLAAHGLTTLNVAHTSLILRKMSDFAAVNLAYGRCFTYANPPSRVTLACADILPAQALVMLSATVAKLPSGTARNGLHVQSRSYWAPANIGPYSQAIALSASGTSEDEVASTIYIAGQIPLVPASMDLDMSLEIGSEPGFASQAVLALQHLERIGRAMKVQNWITVIAFLSADDTGAARERASIARKVWAGATCWVDADDTGSYDEEEDESFDIWNRHRGQGRPAWQQPVLEDLDPSAPLFNATQSLVVILVDSLPRGASIEWVGYGSTAAICTARTTQHAAHLLNIFAQRIV